MFGDQHLYIKTRWCPRRKKHSDPIHCKASDLTDLNSDILLAPSSQTITTEPTHTSFTFHLRLYLHRQRTLQNLNQSSKIPQSTRTKRQIQLKMFSKSSNSSSKTTSSAASTHSTVSTATTLNSADASIKNHKWYSLGSKSSSSDSNKVAIDLQKKKLHNEALASYFSLR